MFFKRNKKNEEKIIYKEVEKEYSDEFKKLYKDIKDYLDSRIEATNGKRSITISKTYIEKIMELFSQMKI